MRKLEEDPKVWDQNAFNDLVRIGSTPSNRSLGNLFYGDKGRLLVGILPAAIFPGGHMFFVQMRNLTW